jgi:two-component system, NtrC family, sensor kinase
MNEQIKILCVDDEENVLKALKRLFFDDDYEIITAASGAEGLAILEKENAQIVISDYRMPAMSGVDFLKEVCRRRPETVRIVLSGYADISSIVSAINEGQIYKFIPKPWNDADLKVTVANALERYFLYKHNNELTAELQQKNEELVRLNVELKKLLEKETANLQFQSKVLTRQQSILDLLPVGIMGIDFGNTVVMCNSKSVDITKNNQFPLDQDIADIVPEDVLQFIGEVKLKKKAVRSMQLYGIKGRLMGSLIEHDDYQKGVILVFIREDNPI